MRDIRYIVFPLAAAFMTLACSERAPAPAPTPARRPRRRPQAHPRPARRTAAAPAFPADRWLGQWNGPEGTFLKLAGGQGSYEVTIRNLDGPRTFAGRAVDGGIEFERDGDQGNLARDERRGHRHEVAGRKSDCLTIRNGEGWCRD